jgi:hypothetical protein
MSSRILSNPAFIAWAIINLAAGIWEVYAYMNRTTLKLEHETLWEKMVDGKINLTNFWIEGWSEYCKVDSRYLREFSDGGYVWWFELLNAFLAVVFILALAFGYSDIIKIILTIAIINCLGYFATLAIEIWQCRLDNRFARRWQYPGYYLISGIWLLVPWCLYEMISRN